MEATEVINSADERETSNSITRARSSSLPTRSTINLIRSDKVPTVKDDRAGWAGLLLYKDLDKAHKEIRLISLLPGDFDAPIQCTLQSVSLLNCPKYEAVSYVWGTEEANCNVKVDGVTFATRPNLFQLLLHLRRRDVPCILWIDGICINQEDIAERSHQVAQMRDVYTTADKVVAWVGLEPDTSRLAFEAFEVWGNCNHLEHHWEPSHHLCFDKKFLSEVYELAITKFMKRPWWHRLWTLQETVLPRPLELVCGNSLLSFDMLFRASGSFFHHLEGC
jgi:hypothetical protein